MKVFSYVRAVSGISRFITSGVSGMRGGFCYIIAYLVIFNGQPGIMNYIESIDSTGLYHIMFAHNSVVLRS